MFKHLTTLFIAASLMTGGVAHGANVYLPGTPAFELANSVEAFLPSNMVPVIVVEDDRRDFDAEVDRSVLTQHGLNDVRFNEIQSQPWSVSIGGAQAYAKVISLDKADDGRAVCFMHFKSAEIAEIALMHEAMHCRTIYTAEWKQWAAQAQKVIPTQIIGSDSNAIPTGLKQYVLAEVHARIMSYLLMNETRTTGDSHFFLNNLTADYPRNPGKNSIIRGLNLCKEVGCDSDASELMKALSKDEAFINAYIADVNAAYGQHLIHGGLERFRR